jgi:hypothetical protein
MSPSSNSTTRPTHNLGQDELLALLRDPSLKPESIREELECAGAAGCSAQSIAEARTLLETAGSAGIVSEVATARALAVSLGNLPELLGAAVLRAAAEAGRQEILLEVAQGQKKGLAKEAKRELQRLKQKGVKVVEVAMQGAPVVKPVELDGPAACYVSSIDAYGERAVWYAKAARTGVDLAQIVVSDIRGILSADALALSRKQHREFLKRLPRGGVVTVAQVPADYARKLIADAESEGTRNGFSPPQGYAQALRILGAAPEGAVANPAADLAYGEQGELAHQLAGGALFSDPLLAAWIPEEEALRAFADTVDDIAKVAADEERKKEGTLAAAKAAAREYFDDVRRARYARRLTEMAHVLRSEGRMDAARAALAVARGLEAGLSEATEPFCTTLFSRALEATGGAGRSPEPAMIAP